MWDYFKCLPESYRGITFGIFLEKCVLLPKTQSQRFNLFASLNADPFEVLFWNTKVGLFWMLLTLFSNIDN